MFPDIDHLVTKRTALYLLAVTTILAIVVSILSLSSGYTIIFQNLFYIPIIISCAIYQRKGFIFSLFLSGIYGGLIVLYTTGFEQYTQAFIRIIIFIIVAAVITFLSEIRYNATTKLQRSEHKFRKLFDTSTTGIALHEIICDSSGTPVDYRFLEVNSAFEKITGLKAAEIIGKTAKEVLPGLEEEWVASYGEVALTGKTIQYENYSQDLGKFFEITAYSPVEGQFVTIIWDITERKKQTETIQEMNSYLENLITHANVPIIVWDPDYKISRINHAFELLVGRSAEELQGKPLTTLFSSALSEQTMSLIRMTATGARWETVEMPVADSDGSIRTVLWNSSTIFKEDGTTPVATIAQGLDVTVEKYLKQEKERVTTQIQENIAKLAILNDGIRNPLTVISSYADMAGDERIDEGIQREVRRIDEMVTNLDREWIHSEKILKYLQKYDNVARDFIPSGHSSPYATQVRDPNGKVLSSPSISSHERFIEEIQARLFTILDSIDAYVYVIDIDTYDILYLNEVARSRLGSGIGYKCYEIIHPGHLEPCKYCTNRFILHKGEPLGVYRWEFNDKTTNQWYDCRDRAIRWTDGRYVRLEIASDITARKRMEKALRESEEQYRRIVDTAEEGIWQMNGAMVTVYSNQRMADILGCSREDMVGRCITSFFAPGELKDHESRMIRRKQGKNDRYERRFARQDGTIVWVLISATALISQDGTFLGSFAMCSDITERKKAEDELKKKHEELEMAFEELLTTQQELKNSYSTLEMSRYELEESEEKFSTAFLMNLNPAAITDIETGIIIDVNPSFTSWSGYSKEELVGKSTRDLNFWVLHSERDELIRLLHGNEEVLDRRVSIRVKNGDVRDCLFSARIITRAGKKYLYSQSYDISQTCPEKNPEENYPPL